MYLDACITLRKVIATWISVFLIFYSCSRYALYSPTDLAYIDRIHTQENHYRSESMQQYLLRFGIRDVWIIHPPDRVPQQTIIRKNEHMALLRYRIAAAFDHNTLSSMSQCLSISRTYPDSNLWLLEDHFNDSELANPVIADVYGGWQAHMYCWERVSAYYQQSRLDMPVLILEDDVLLHPLFLIKIRQLLSDAPPSWNIIVLSSQSNRNTAGRNPFLLLNEPTFGSCYLVRTATLALSLYELNNEMQPPFRFSEKNTLVGWKPHVPANLTSYRYMKGGLIYGSDSYTSNHSPLFTPL